MIYTLILISGFTSFYLEAKGFNYFDNEIDYWKHSVSNNVKSDKSQNPNKPEKSEFDWSKHLNPKNDEFFKEGNHIPPAAFMELARNPTDQISKTGFYSLKRKMNFLVNFN